MRKKELERETRSNAETGLQVKGQRWESGYHKQQREKVP